ncbi:MAG: hypothetical protein ACRD0H_03665 [Actinomycetes bacterium]
MTITAAYRTAPDYAAAVTADLHNLPTGRLTSRENAAHIFTNRLDDLTAWLTARGGYTTHERAAGDLTNWTLRTSTEPRADGTSTPVLVHAQALTHEPVPAELTAALA